MKQIQVTVVLPDEKPMSAPEYHFCYQCRHFIRHYIHDGVKGVFSPLECGHCMPPKKYAHLKSHKSTDPACMWFESKTSLGGLT